MVVKDYVVDVIVEIEFNDLVECFESFGVWVI